MLSTSYWASLVSTCLSNMRVVFAKSGEAGVSVMAMSDPLMAGDVPVCM